MTGPIKLINDDVCRLCYHVHDYVGRCGQVSHDPGPNDTDVTSICICEQYVDLKAQSKIVVRVEP